MTTPADIHRLLHRITNSANIAEARLEHATESLTLRAADGYPTKASGTPTNGSASTSELTPTEAAAHTNLGDLYGYNDTTYNPGPITSLADLADELRASLTSLDRAQTELTKAGVPPLATDRYRCTGINGGGCSDWQDINRADHLCIDCGRSVDSNRRRLRRHKAS